MRQVTWWSRIDHPQSYIRLAIHSDGTATETTVYDGDVVARKEFDEAPSPWPVR